MNQAARVFSLLLCLIVGAGTIAPAPAQAAERGASSGIILAQADGEPRERKGIFRFLFRNRENRQRREMAPQREFRLVPRRERDGTRGRQAREAAPSRREQPRKQARGGKSEQQAAKPRKQRKNRPAAAAVPREAKVVEKAPDAKRVVVLGDFLGSALAKGLIDTFAQNADVVVVDASKGDSGLVRSDHYNWAAEIPAVMEAHKPDAILMLLGANDRQTINTETGPQPIGSEGWRLAYGSRVGVLADALKATAKPVLWAGLAPVKPSAMSRDYSAFNGVVREQLEVRGMRYVDVWNGFADETGKFVSAGPDVNGQPAQLRDGDGVNFTKAGQRKLAFFVERELNELLGTAQPLQAAATPATPTNIEPADQPPRIGPMIPLDTVAVAGDALSAGTAPTDPGRGTVAATVSNRLTGGANVAPPPGRADDFAWPARPLLAPAPPPVPGPVPLASAPPPPVTAPAPAGTAPAPVLVVPATVQPIAAPPGSPVPAVNP